MDIKDILKEQENILLKLTKLMDIEKEVLIKDRTSELNSIIGEKRELAKQMVVIEKKRMELYGEKTSEEFASEGLVDRDSIERLKKLIIDIKEKDETNLILTKQSLNYIRTITSAINPNQRVVTYGNSGRIGDPTSKGVFTTKV